MLLNCGVGEDFWESLGLQRDPTSPSYRKSVLNIHWKNWCWSWNSNTLAIWCEELTHLKRPWCWERLRAGKEGDDRGWDGWMASLTQWTWVWINSGSWWWTGRPGVLQSTGLQRVRRDWATELTDWLNDSLFVFIAHSSMSFVLLLSPFYGWEHGDSGFTAKTPWMETPQSAVWEQESWLAYLPEIKWGPLSPLVERIEEVTLVTCCPSVRSILSKSSSLLPSSGHWPHCFSWNVDPSQPRRPG